MRNLFSLLLAILLFLNVFGYYGVFLGLQYRNDLSMTTKLDTEHFTDEKSFTIKIPITVPYASDSRGFERVNGEFEYNGEFYRLVKQKLSQDTLYIVCVKDVEHKKIHEALSGFVKTFSDQTANSQSSQTGTVITFIKDYIPHSFALDNESFGWESDVVKEGPFTNLIPAFASSVIHPPERV